MVQSSGVFGVGGLCLLRNFEVSFSRRGIFVRPFSCEPLFVPDLQEIRKSALLSYIKDLNALKSTKCVPWLNAVPPLPPCLQNDETKTIQNEEKKTIQNDDKQSIEEKISIENDEKSAQKLEKNWEKKIENSTEKNGEQNWEKNRGTKYAKNREFHKLYEIIHKWSVTHPAAFWATSWDFLKICPPLASGNGNQYLQKINKIVNQHANIPNSHFQSYQFFKHQNLNFAQNLLKFRESEDTAILFEDEAGSRRRLSFRSLYRLTAVFHASVKHHDPIRKGQRVCAIAANTPETIVAMLAVTSLGGIWSSCSPDFGAGSIIDRFGQIEPTLLFTTDSYPHKGTPFPVLPKAEEVAKKIESIKRVVVLPFEGLGEEIEFFEKNIQNPNPLGPVVDIFAYTQAFREEEEIEFAKTNVNDPLFVLFSSGTTGLPKALLHRQGLLLQLLKEHQLQCNLKPGDRVLYMTTCGWMMWNWLATCLGSGVTILLFEGNVLYPSPNRVLLLATQMGATFLGVSAKLIQLWQQQNLSSQSEGVDLSKVKTIGSTGSPLSNEGFRYVYSKLKTDIRLMSMSGGTDICSCFVIGNPFAMVYEGEIQGKGLGMGVQILKQGQKCNAGVKGELSCNVPFPSQPLSLWNDDGQHTLYQKTYFENGVWSQGDLAEETENSGIIIHGRSDSVLNPGGVRIGTAEIYRHVEKVEDVISSVVIGREIENDVEVLLFVKLKSGKELSERIKRALINAIRNGASPRHVPKAIYSVADIPYTWTGKVCELAVKDIVLGRPVANLGSIANPTSLEFFKLYSSAT